MLFLSIPLEGASTDSRARQRALQEPVSMAERGLDNHVRPVQTGSICDGDRRPDRSPAALRQEEVGG